MYLRAKKRIKDGKEHRYWSIVESCRNLDGRVVQRQVLYLGEINDSQKAAWCRTIDVLQTDSSAKQMALFPTDRQAPELDCEVVQVTPARQTRRAVLQHRAFGRDHAFAHGRPLVFSAR